MTDCVGAHCVVTCTIRGSDLPLQKGLESVVRCFAQFRSKPRGQATEPYNRHLHDGVILLL